MYEHFDLQDAILFLERLELVLNLSSGTGLPNNTTGYLLLLHVFTLKYSSP